MATRPSADGPIACTLGVRDINERRDWIAELNRKALMGARQDGLQLVLTYRPRHAATPREMVHLEQQCCGFLGFDLTETSESVTLVVDAPESAAGALNEVFAPYLTGAGSGCGCVSRSSEKGEGYGCD